MEGYMTTAEAMEYLGVTRCRVLQLHKAGLLEGEKMGNQYIFTRASVERRKRDNPGAGNPNFGKR